jgi:WD40-like Beta Propeller Repeat
MLLTTPRLLFALAVSGAAVAVAVPSAQAASPGENGKIAYIQFEGEQLYELHVMNQDGSGDVTLKEGGTALNPVWSPDGSKIAYEFREHIDADAELRVHDVTTGADDALTDDDVDQIHPTWSPDGRSIAYSENGDIFERSADPANESGGVVLNDESGYDAEPAWSSTDQIAFRREGDQFGGDILVMPGAGGEAESLIASSADESMPNWSPDGTRLVYSRNNETAIRTVGENDDDIVGPDPEVDADPVFSPDGTKVLWASSRQFEGEWGGPSFYTANAGDGSGVAPLVDDLYDAIHPDWQPVGGKIPGGGPKPRPQEPGPDAQQGGAGGPSGGAAQPQQTGATPRLARAGSAIARKCVSKRSFRIRLRVPKKEGIASAAVLVNGKPAKVKMSGDRHTATVDLRTLPKGTWAVRIRTKTKAGRTITETRHYRTCAPRKAKNRG